MKFCPECGSTLNDSVLCQTCGYNTKTHELTKSNKNNNNNDIIGICQNIIMPDIEKHDLDNKSKEISLEELKKDKLNYSSIKKVIYYDSPTTTNRIDSYVLDFDKKILSCSFYNLFSTDAESKVYDIDDETLNNVKNIIEENNMAAWRILKREFAGTMYKTRSNMEIVVGEETYQIFSDVIMTSEEEKVFRDLETYIKSKMV